MRSRRINGGIGGLLNLFTFSAKDLLNLDFLLRSFKFVRVEKRESS
jgi:hypothetical protein